MNSSAATKNEYFYEQARCSYDTLFILYVCGDHRQSSTLDGAMISGRRAADAYEADMA